MIALNSNKPVWVRDNEHGFVPGKINDIGSDNVTVQLHDTKKVFKIQLKIKIIIRNLFLGSCCSI